MRRPTILTMAAVLAAALLAGCGDDDAVTTGAPPTTEAPVTTGAPPSTEAPATTAAEEPPPATEAPAAMALRSPAFEDGETIPERYTCDGANATPPLTFEGVPGFAASLALTVVDPDGNDWIHWAAWNIPPDSAGLGEQVPAGDLPDGTRQAANDFARGFAAGDQFPGGAEVRIQGWDGPCPPRGTHRYVFTLYALTGTIDLPTGTPGGEILAALEAARSDGSLVGEAVLVGLYGRG